MNSVRFKVLDSQGSYGFDRYFDGLSIADRLPEICGGLSGCIMKI
jgi:hypothetical protein